MDTDRRFAVAAARLVTLRATLREIEEYIVVVDGSIVRRRLRVTTQLVSVEWAINVPMPSVPIIRADSADAVENKNATDRTDSRQRA